jgi:hypothetical protein|tara:strand:- start:235 stop:564 length:330 start_codon:yes stop_codon:yes gene_type:complete
MSKFFGSRIIQEEMQDIFETQKDLYAVIMKFASMTDEEKKEHMNKLISLIDKQEVMWTRLSLSDDPEAKQMKEKIQMTSAAMGFKEVNMNTIFDNMRQTLENLSSKLHT